MNTNLVDINKIKAEAQQKIEHNELIEITRKICEIKAEVNRKEAKVVSNEREINNLTTECINLKIEHEIEVGKQKMLEDEVRKLKKIYDIESKLEKDNFEKLCKYINEFLEKSDRFLMNNRVVEKNNSKEVVAKSRKEKLRMIALEGQVAGLEMFLTTQNKILAELNHN